MYHAMCDELTKIALGVVEREASPQHMLGGHGMLTPSHLMSPMGRATYSVPEGKALLRVAPTEDHLKQLGGIRRLMTEGTQKNVGEDLRNVTRRHELIHYMRARKGLMDGAGKPGIRNVLRTLREETAAGLGAAIRAKNPVIRALSIPSALGGAGVSTSNAYAHTGGVGKALLGGSIGKVLRALRLAKTAADNSTRDILVKAKATTFPSVDDETPSRRDRYSDNVRLTSPAANSETNSPLPG